MESQSLPPSRGRLQPRLACARAALLAAPLALIVALTGCDTARILAPPPSLRAASAAPYAVDVQFAEPLDRASAEDPSRYSVLLVGGSGSSASVSSATLIDTVNWRVVQLVIPEWFGDSTADRRTAIVTTNGILDYFGRSTGERSVTFVTGLSYAQPMKALFDARCSPCHGASNPGGGYRTDSYEQLFGAGTSPAPNLIPGDPSCQLVVKCRPRNSMYKRANLDFFDYEAIVNWVSVYQARP